MKCGIYGIRNIVDGKWYVGQSVRIEERRGRHFGRLAQGTHFNEHLQASYNCYGKECFDFHILEEVPEDMLDIRERSWIEYYESTQKRYGYNREDGGSFSKRHSEETKLKIGKAHKGKIITKEMRLKMSLAHIGKKLSEETCRNMSIARKGHTTSLETRRKIGEANKGNKHFLGHRHSPESIIKMSLASKGRPKSAEHCQSLSEAHKGEKNFNFGKHFSEEHRKHLSESIKKAMAIYNAKRR